MDRARKALRRIGRRRRLHSRSPTGSLPPSPGWAHLFPLCFEPEIVPLTRYDFIIWYNDISEILSRTSPPQVPGDPALKRRKRFGFMRSTERLRKSVSTFSLNRKWRRCGENSFVTVISRNFMLFRMMLNFDLIRDIIPYPISGLARRTSRLG